MFSESAASMPGFAWVYSVWCVGRTVEGVLRFVVAVSMY